VVDEIIVSGPVILKRGKLLVIKEDKDDFYKLPGGRVEKDENLEETCIREIKEEIGGEIIILEKLSTLILSENPTTHKKMRIELHHYLAELKNPLAINPIEPIKEIKWLSLDQIKRKKYAISPNIRYLLEQGDLK
jgi:ADP-ribose pyrophosphatase YjhB (NUDIX family)